MEGTSEVVVNGAVVVDATVGVELFLPRFGREKSVVLFVVSSGSPFSVVVAAVPVLKVVDASSMEDWPSLM